VSNQKFKQKLSAKVLNPEVMVIVLAVLAFAAEAGATKNAKTPTTSLSRASNRQTNS
jgi:hypothetical protein